MRRLWIPVCVSILALLVGCASVDTSTAGGAPAKGTPASWKYFDDFYGLGLTMTESPPVSLTGVGALTLSTKQNVELLVMAENKSAGNASPTLKPVRDGTSYRFEVFFETSGEWEVSLLGKPASTQGNRYFLLARTRITVSVDPNAPLVYPAFSRYGLAFATPPETRVAEETTVSMTRQKELDISWSFTNVKTGESLGNAVSVDVSEKRLVVTVPFPATGDYALTLWGREKGKSSEEGEKLVRLPFSATVDPGKLPKYPAGWKPGPGFKKYGVTVTSSPEGPVTDWTTLLFSLKKGVGVATSYRNTTTGKGYKELGSIDETSVEDGAARSVLYFPESGDYTVWLFGKEKDDKDYTLIAAVSVKATATDRTGLVPENWAVERLFWRDGITVVSSTPRQTRDTLNVLLRPPEGMEISVMLMEKKDEKNYKYSSMVTCNEEGQDRRIVGVFPKAGEYELRISAKAKDDKYARQIARVSFTATVDAAAAPYRLWQIGGGWPVLPVDKVEDAKGAWKLFPDRGTDDDVHQKGALSADVNLPVGEATVTLRKGSFVEFSVDREEKTVYELAFTLPRDLQRKIGDQTVTFKAGTSFSLGRWYATGSLSRDMTLTLEAGAISLPKGSRITTMGGDLWEIGINGKAVYTFDKKSYECTEGVFISMYSSGDLPTEFRIVTTKPLPMKFGTTSFTLPAGSQIAFTKNGLDHFVFLQDTEITVNGNKETITPGWAAKFDDTGAMQKSQVEWLE